MIIDILRKVDYQTLRFMAKRGINRYKPLKFVGLDHIDELCSLLVEKVRKSGFQPETVVGIGTSGIYPAWKISNLLKSNIGFIWIKKDGSPLDDFFFKDKILSVFPKSLRQIFFEGPVVTHEYLGPKLGGEILLIDDEADSGGTLALTEELLFEHNPEIDIKKAVLYKYPNSQNVDLFSKAYQMRDALPPLELRLPMRKYSPLYHAYRYQIDSLGIPVQPPSSSPGLFKKIRNFSLGISQFLDYVVWGIGLRIKRMKIEKIFHSVFSIPEKFYFSLKEEGIDTLVLDYEGVLKTIRGGIVNKKVIPFLQRLNEIGFKWTVVSNCCEKDGKTFKEVIHSVFPSAEVHINAGKPDASQVLLSLKNMCSSPENAVFIGDNPLLDIKTARNAGINRILLVPPLNKQYASFWQEVAIKIFDKIFSLKPV